MPRSSAVLPLCQLVCSSAARICWRSTSRRDVGELAVSRRSTLGERQLLSVSIEHLRGRGHAEAFYLTGLANYQYLYRYLASWTNTARTNLGTNDHADRLAQ